MKLKIDDDAMIDDFFGNTRLLGIVAPQKDYMFIWHINQLLGFKFRSSSDIEIQLQRKKRLYYFNIYQYQEPQTTTLHLLYENHHDGEFLLPEFRHLDFLWLIKECALSDEEFKSLQDALKSMQGVQLVNEMVHEKIKNKAHLMY